MGQVQTKAKLSNIEIQIPTTVNPDQMATCPTNNDNPGSFQSLHKQCQSIVPDCFEGIRVLINKPLSNHFQIMHLLNLNNPINAPSYKFGTTFVGTTKLPNSEEQYPVLQGDINTVGTVSANVIHYLTPSLRVQFAGQFSGDKHQPALGQLTTDWFGQYFTASLTAVNPNRYMQPNLVAAQYLHAVTSNIAVGAEVVYDTTAKHVAKRVASLSAAARIKNGDNLWTATAGTAGADICAYFRVSDSIQFGVQSSIGFHTRKATGSISYQVNLKKSVFRGMVDSTWTVGAVMERSLDLIPLTLSLSASLNHVKQHIRVGLGVSVQ